MEIMEILIGLCAMAIPIIMVVLLVYFIVQRVDDMKNEDFEKRDN